MDRMEKNDEDDEKMD